MVRLDDAVFPLFLLIIFCLEFFLISGYAAGHNLIVRKKLHLACWWSFVSLLTVIGIFWASQALARHL